VGRTLTITSDDVTLSGYGATLKLADGAANGTSGSALRNTAGQVHVIRASGVKGRRIKRVVIKGLTIDGNIYNQKDYYNPRGIVCEYAESVLVRDVRIVRAFVALDFGIGCKNCEARRCLIEDFAEDGFDASGDAHHTSGGVATDIRFIDCHARNAPRAGGNAWEIEDGAQGVLVQDCTVKNVGGNGFGIRNHWQRKVVDISKNIELRRVRIEEVRGKYGVYSHSAPADKFPTNRMTDVRLIDVECDAQALFYGPTLEGLHINGGAYKALYLGWEYGSKQVKEPGGPLYPLKQALIENAAVGYIKINGKAGDILLRNVAVTAEKAADGVGVRVVGGSDNVKMVGCTITGAAKSGVLIEKSASPLILNSIIWGNGRAVVMKRVSEGRAREQFDGHEATGAWNPKGRGNWAVDCAADMVALGPDGASGRLGKHGVRIRNQSGTPLRTSRLYWRRTVDKDSHILKVHARANQDDAIFLLAIRERPGGPYLSCVYFWNDGTFRRSAIEDGKSGQPTLFGGRKYTPGTWYDIRMNLDFDNHRYRLKLGRQAWSDWFRFVEGPRSRATAVCFYGLPNGAAGSVDIDRVEITGGDAVEQKPCAPEFTHSCVRGGLPKGAVDGSGNLTADPLFVRGPGGGLYLSHKDAGQDVQSPCADAGRGQAAEYGMHTFTTRTDSAPDTDQVDMGYHYPR